MTSILKLSLFLIFLLLTGRVTVVAQSTAPPADIDAYVEQVRSQFNVPGIGLAVVKDGKVVLAKGYGVRTMGKRERVDARTLFGIASNTKAFTATALALLVEEGKIAWDAPVITYLPWFRLSDPYVTKEMTIQDLLVHRSGLGLGAGDLLWWPPSTYDRKEIARRLSAIPLATSFRSAYAYDNVLYLVAGEVIETVSGQSWEDFVAQRILARVGMTGSGVRHSDVERGENVATPHAEIEGRVRVIKPFSSDNTNPAGGIVSCAEDMAKWLIVQLDSGRVADGSRLFTPQTTQRLWTIVTPLAVGSQPPETAALQANFNGYGLGFGVRDLYGKKIVTHTGGLPGYVSLVLMVPELKLGIAVLTNQESGAAFNAIAFRILDHYFNKPTTDWTAKLKTVMARRDSMVVRAELQIRSQRDSTSHPSLPLEKYAGTYVDPWYGEIVITRENGKLIVRFSHTPSLEGELVHWQYDTFVARWKDPELRADAFVTFALTPDGRVDQAKMRAVSPATDFSFDFQDLTLKPQRKESH